MDVILILLEFAMTLALVAVLSVALYFAYSRLRLKGYPPPAAGLTLALCLVAGIALGAWRMAGIPEPVSNLQLFVFAFYLPMAATAVFAGLATVMLPARGVRSFGARRPGFPFDLVGRGLVGLGVLGAVAAFVASVFFNLAVEQLGRALTLVVGFVIPSGLYFVYLGRRTQVVTAPVWLDPGTGALSLYLRAFNQESQFFVIGPKSQYGSYASGWAATVATADQNVGVTFEGYFGPLLSRSVGRFVALGSPQDYIAPQGAERMYAKDADWMRHLEALASRAVCVVVEVGESANLRWEFEHLKATGQQDKLFVFTRPRAAPGTRLAHAYWELLSRVKGVAKTTWTRFAAELSSMGYAPGEDPGAGAVLTFDTQGRAVLLTSEAATPDEFIEPIERWIRRRERIGRCIVSSCADCGSRTFDWPTDPPAASVACTECVRRRQRAARSMRERWFDALPTWFAAWFCACVPLSIATFVLMPQTPWLDEWVGWLGTLFIFVLAALPFGIGYLLPGRRP